MLAPQAFLAVILCCVGVFLHACGGDVKTTTKTPSTSTSKPQPIATTTVTTTTVTTTTTTTTLECDNAYANVHSCPKGSNQGKPQNDWKVSTQRECVGPCDGYSSLQFSAKKGVANDAIKSRNHGSLISPKNQIPKSVDELRCWFLPEFAWGMQQPGHPSPPWNPQPEAAYIDDAGNALGGGLPGPDSTVACCCQEECTMEMIELRHWIFNTETRKKCGNNVDDNYNTDGNSGRVLLTRASDRGGKLKNLKHEACMCGDRTPENQLPFYYYVVQGPSGPQQTNQAFFWLDSLRTAYNNLFDIWARNPPCSGECLIMGGASDAWVTYGRSTATSVYFQLRAFAAFDPLALKDACGDKGVMLRFGGMTLDGNTVTCNGKDDWGPTGAPCKTITQINDAFHGLVTQEDDNAFMQGVGELEALTLETDRASVTISSARGLEVSEKTSNRGSCSGSPQPTLNFPWRCQAHGGMNDTKGCLSMVSPSREVVVSV